jgi:NAD-dependent DNA ligase
LPDLQRRIVEMLPGCGMALARQLLQHFGTIQRIVAASTTELGQVHGIGAGKAAEIFRALHAEYEAVDTEKQLEDVLEAMPELLFDRPLTLVARQHIFATLQEDRQIVDLVFFDPERNELILVELKRSALRTEHERQLEAYLDEAHRSPLLRTYLGGGAQVRGILATVEPGEYAPRNPSITARVVDKQAVIRGLKELRHKRLRPSG